MKRNTDWTEGGDGHGLQITDYGFWRGTRIGRKEGNDTEYRLRRGTRVGRKEGFARIADHRSQITDCRFRIISDCGLAKLRIV
jgi:hypothetical protein